MKQKKAFFILVPDVDGKLFKGRVFVSQQRAKLVDGVQTEGEKTDVLSPNGFGIFTVSGDEATFKARMSAMEAFVEKKNKPGEAPFIVGPFDTSEEATKEMHKVRPKTAEQEAGELRGVIDSQKDTIADLKKQLEEAKKAGAK